VGTWRLSHPKQCANCPWREDARLSTIPGYSVEKHLALKSTISSEFESLTKNGPVMACHKSKEKRVCIGWLVNQAGVGNNFAVRLGLLVCENSGDIEVFGPQHDTLEKTMRLEGET